MYLKIKLREAYSMLFEADDDEPKKKKSADKKKKRELDFDEPDASAFDEPDLSAFTRGPGGAMAKPKDKGDVATGSKEKVKATPGKARSAGETAQDMAGAADKIHQGAGTAAQDAWEKFSDAAKDIDDEIPAEFAADDTELRQGLVIGQNPAQVPGFAQPVPDQLQFQPNALAQIDKRVDMPFKPKELDLDIKWHQVRHLPGYAIKQIRGAFRPLFQNYMDNQLEEIEVATTLTSSPGDMQKLVQHIIENGKQFKDFSLEAFGIDPEVYHVEKAHMYKVNDGTTCMVIRERLGPMTNFYVYKGKTKGKSNKLGWGEGE